MTPVLRWRLAPAQLRAARLDVPGDKSITHRAILCGLLGAGETAIVGANPGADARTTLAAARALGAQVSEADGVLRIRGTAGALAEPADVLDCGNSGTALRLLAGVLAARPLLAVLTGDPSLRSRPVDRVVRPLREMGANLSARAGDRLPPLVVRGAELRGASFLEPTGSAQVASAVLFAGLAARGETRVRVNTGVRDHTVRMLPAFGARVEVERSADGSGEWRVSGEQTLSATRVEVPGDPSAAAFFAAAAAITPGLSIEIANVSLNPTRLGFFEVLREMGASIEVERGPDRAGEPAGSLRVAGPAELRAVEVGASRVPAMVDEIPAWAVVAAVARGTSQLSGAGELRVKESDRLRALAANLTSLGVAVVERAEGLEITGGAVNGGTVRAGGDHRIAMAFAILAARAAKPIEIDDAAMVATSFPGFAAAWRSLGGSLEEGEMD